ncbi:hypothetical protein QUB21_09140, partial [Microcoleus sp. AT9b-C4]
LAGPDGGGVSTPGGPRWWRVFNPWRAPMVAGFQPLAGPDGGGFSTPGGLRRWRVRPRRICIKPDRP